MLRIAVVDDHPVFRAGLRAVLSSETGLQIVAEASNARDAYDAIDGAHPDMVLLDLSLPGPDGLTVAREILRRDPQRRILLLPPLAEESLVADALAMGALGCVGKDQPLAELLEAVRAVSEGKRYLPPSVSAEAVVTRVRRGRGGPLGLLSGREREVFELLVRGFTNEQIGGHLQISKRTAETHRSRILKKLQVHSAVELTRLAARHGLLAD